jgi:hypothetical protein
VYSKFTALLPDGKPHKKPIIIAIVEYFDTLKILEIGFCIKLDKLLKIFVFIAISLSNINGKRDGTIPFRKMSILCLTESMYLFDRSKSKSKTDKKIPTYIIDFMFFLEVSLDTIIFIDNTYINIMIKEINICVIAKI